MYLLKIEVVTTILLSTNLPSGAGSSRQEDSNEKTRRNASLQLVRDQVTKAMKKTEIWS